MAGYGGRTGSRGIDREAPDQVVLDFARMD
jgi:hypothetical protein